MQSRSSQAATKLLTCWQFQTAEALSGKAFAHPATQRSLATASQTASAQAQSAQAPTADAHAAKLAYAQKLRELRKTWQEQRAEKLANRAKADAIRDANKAKAVEAHRRNVSVIKELRIQIDQEKRRLQMAELVQSK